MSDPIRDCHHGHMKGKCDSCELIEAETRIAELEAVAQAVEKYFTGYTMDELARLEAAMLAAGYLGVGDE
jgi:thymidine phosphorylase